MTTLLVLLGLLVVAGVPYIAWTRLDARSHRRAAALHEDVLALGDEAFPPSIHPEIDLSECIGSGACVRACPEGEVLAITDGRARLVNPLACIGHGACLAACPVGAIRLVFGTATRGVELPKLTPSFETSQPGVYIVGELGGMGLIRNAVEQGRQAADAIARAGRRAKADQLDAVVIGAGPAGISCALALLAHQRSVLVVDQEKYGGTIAHYPRAKVVMTGSFDLPGFGRVRRKTMSKEQLLELWHEVRDRTGLSVREGVRVEALRREPQGWLVEAEGFRQQALHVVLALGRRGAPRKLGVPGEELAKVSYRLLEPEPFAGQHVLVVGGGNAAADCALALAQFKGCASVGLSYRRAELARLRPSVRAAIERAFADRTITAHLQTELMEIRPAEVLLKTPRGQEPLRNDHVIVQIGGQAPGELLRTIGIELVEKRGEA
ncbi:MAG: NAD(P)-binding domain-containing protein [Myxococcales bacterium]|nr:NAD(P)-binding domain-containing protein [Myxococcales bacterium]